VRQVHAIDPGILKTCYAGSGNDTQIIWGPTAGSAILVCDPEVANADIAGLYYIDSSTRNPQKLLTLEKQAYGGLDSGDAAAITSNRELILLNANRHSNSANENAAGRLVKLRWDTSPPMAPSVVESSLLQGDFTPYSLSEVHAKAIDPWGRYAVVSRFVVPVSTSKTSTSTYTGQGVVELWTLGDLEPSQPMRLSIGPASAIRIITSADEISYSFRMITARFM
jgi:hypothetical protein